jgi:hypothetical protein
MCFHLLAEMFSSLIFSCDNTTHVAHLAHLPHMPHRNLRSHSMDTEPHQTTADAQTSPVIPATRIVRTRKKSPKTAEAADNPVRKRRKTNSKNVIQGHEKPEIGQDNLGEKMGPKRKRIYGKLAELPNMPLDILFEVKLDTIDSQEVSEILFECRYLAT